MVDPSLLLEMIWTGTPYSTITQLLKVDPAHDKETHLKRDVWRDGEGGEGRKAAGNDSMKLIVHLLGKPTINRL